MIKLYKESDNSLIEDIVVYNLCHNNIFDVLLTIKTDDEFLLTRSKAYYLSYYGKRKLLICTDRTSLDISEENEFPFEFKLVNAEKAIELYEQALADKEASLQACLLGNETPPVEEDPIIDPDPIDPDPTEDPPELEPDPVDPDPTDPE